MNIRKYEENEIGDIVEPWYNISIMAHYFISDDYWKDDSFIYKGEYKPSNRVKLHIGQAMG